MMCLVQESRQLMKLGKLDAAEAKAMQAQRMNVVPALTADRAESVLHDIAMARVRSVPGSPAATPTVDPPSLVAEHRGQRLLDKGDQAKAAAKFAESEKLRDQGIKPGNDRPGNGYPASGHGYPACGSRNLAPAIANAAPAVGTVAPAIANAVPAVDMSVQKSSSGEPAAEPLLRPARWSTDSRCALLLPLPPASPHLNRQARAMHLSHWRPPICPSIQEVSRAGRASQGRCTCRAGTGRPAQRPSHPYPPLSRNRPLARASRCSSSAKTLYTSGNYPAARQMAEEAKAGNLRSRRSRPTSCLRKSDWSNKAEP